jgi:cob(I)alamin adenosyltransferase
MNKGLVTVITGEGKGKTTSALGMMLRAWGNGMKVVVLQFIKSPKRQYGELKAARKMGVEMVQGGAGFVFPKTVDIEFHKSVALAQWEVARDRIISGDYDMVILDELTYALKFGWIPMDELLSLLEQRPAAQHVIITGRDAPQALIDFADTVSEVKDIKHHFRQGVKAQPGIEL